MKKTSTVGDDIGVDFYHTNKSDSKCNQLTYITDRQGNWNSIKNGKGTLSGQKRTNDVNWETVYNEWSTGSGPERSLFEGNYPANMAIQGSYLFNWTYADFQASGLSKQGVEVNFGLSDIVMSDNNMQAQMMGSYNASFYKLGR